MTWFFIIACRQSELKDGWWQNDAANPYVSGNNEESEGEEEGEGEESGFYGILEAVDESYEGESGVETDACLWYAVITAEETDACSDCSFGVTVTYTDFEVINNNDCPDYLDPSNLDGSIVELGFAGETTWRLSDGEWVEFATYFEEGTFFGWYGSL